jgi:hypothetical protein
VLDRELVAARCLVHARRGGQRRHTQNKDDLLLHLRARVRKVEAIFDGNDSRDVRIAGGCVSRHTD